MGLEFSAVPNIINKIGVLLDEPAWAKRTSDKALCRF
jgi:hypothetical protein